MYVTFERTYMVIFAVVLVILSLTAPIGRLYFLIEAFISLRQESPRIYETVKWTNFWPHA